MFGSVNATDVAALLLRRAVHARSSSGEAKPAE